MSEIGGKAEVAAARSKRRRRPNCDIAQASPRPMRCAKVGAEMPCPEPWGGNETARLYKAGQRYGNSMAPRGAGAADEWRFENRLHLSRTRSVRENAEYPSVGGIAQPRLSLTGPSYCRGPRQRRRSGAHEAAVGRTRRQ